MNSLISFLSADISVAFAFSIMMVAILIMAAITQVMQSDYEDTIHVMAKDLDETTERYQDLVYRLFDTIEDAQVIIDKQEETNESMEETIFSLHCDISDMAHNEMAMHHYHEVELIKLHDEIKELKLQLEDNKLVASYVPNYFKPLTEVDVNELAKMEL